VQISRQSDFRVAQWPQRNGFILIGSNSNMHSTYVIESGRRRTVRSDLAAVLREYPALEAAYLGGLQTTA
jgi:hypothetical protein